MKYTNKINKTSHPISQQDTSGCRKGVSLAPPEYRIEFADNYWGFAPSGDAFEREADARARHTVTAGPKGGKGPTADARHA
ncbi:MAG: hypothetical protein JSW39_21100 [Desulfobacterales bacterium]|nr:MAG: hypothetical protein JSW39_21100 [Desulfobacterales bacterium]